MISASLCRLHVDPAIKPSLANSQNIECGSSKHLCLAGAGWAGVSIWLLWVTTFIRRKSIDSSPITNLYSLPFVAAFTHAKVLLGVSSGVYARAHPDAFLIFSIAVTTWLLAIICYCRPPCRF